MVLLTAHFTLLSIDPWKKRLKGTISNFYLNSVKQSTVLILVYVKNV